MDGTRLEILLSAMYSSTSTLISSAGVGVRGLAGSQRVDHLPFSQASPNGSAPLPVLCRQHVSFRVLG